MFRHHQLAICQRRSKNASAGRNKNASGGDNLASVVKRPIGGTLSGVVGVVGVGLGSLLALLEPEAVAVHFEDVDVMGQAVEQGAGEAL